VLRAERRLTCGRAASRTVGAGRGRRSAAAGSAGPGWGGRRAAGGADRRGGRGRPGVVTRSVGVEVPGKFVFGSAQPGVEPLGSPCGPACGGAAPGLHFGAASREAEGAGSCFEHLMLAAQFPDS
jgi:hypothetical protein